MFLRALSKQGQLFPQLSYVQGDLVCCLRRYYRDGQDVGYKGGKSLKEAMEDRAKEFMENLDDEHLERKQYLEQMMEQWRYENYRVPNEMNDLRWCELLQQKPVRGSYLKYLGILYLKESTKQEKEEEQLERLRLLEEDEAMYDHLYHLSYERDRQILMWKKLSAMNSEIPVIIDLDFPGLYQKEERKVSDHVIRALRKNAFHPQPLNFHITSCKKNLRLLDYEIAGRVLPGGHFHEQHYLDLFPPEQLVYLSPDGPPLDTFDINSIYIVAGTDKVDYNDMFVKVQKQGIRCASFPLYFHGRLKTTSDFSIYKALDIVRSMYYWHSWKSAFTECLPPHQFTLKDKYARKRKPIPTKSFWHKDRPDYKRMKHLKS